MMTMTITMMMNLLSGTKVKKTQGPESKNRKKVNAYCLSSTKVVGLVNVRGREKNRQKNCGSSCF